MTFYPKLWLHADGAKAHCDVRRTSGIDVLDLEGIHRRKNRTEQNPYTIRFGFRQYDCEFFTSVSCYQIHLAAALRGDNLRYCTQALITARVTVVIIETLEVVDIE